MTNNYFVVFWRNLSTDEVSVSAFEREYDAQEFSNNLVSKGYSVFFVYKKSNDTNNSVSNYKMKRFGAYSFYKRVDRWLILLLGLGILGAYQLVRTHFIK